MNWNLIDFIEPYLNSKLAINRKQALWIFSNLIADSEEMRKHLSSIKIYDKIFLLIRDSSFEVIKELNYIIHILLLTMNHSNIEYLLEDLKIFDYVLFILKEIRDPNLLMQLFEGLWFSLSFFKAHYGDILVELERQGIVSYLTKIEMVKNPHLSEIAHLIIENFFPDKEDNINKK
jgi:hypothetical protein